MDNNYIKYTIRQLLIIVSAVVLMISSFNTFAQNGNKISGKVTSAKDGKGLPGLTIFAKGTSNGTITDSDGNYNITAPEDAILVFSFIGFRTQEVVVGSQTSIDVIMEESIEAIDEVVVTALGIKREEKSLGFSVGKVGGEELNRVAQENLLNSMAGKVSGVTINSTGGAGSSVSMVIRGASSMSSDNQPLFIIDGVPVSNTVNNVGGFGSDNRVDYGNAIADLDPENIADVSILKGPSAAALYGSRAGNGVVMITTKKGATDKGMKVTVTSNTVFDIPVRFLDVQTKFATGFFSYRPENVGSNILPDITTSDGTGSGPELDKGYWAVQWDSPVDANGVRVPTELRSYPNNFRNFINDYAFTSTNGAAISGSSEKLSYRFSVNNMTHKGLVPNSDLNKNTVALSASSKVRQNFTLSTDINFSNSWADNRPASNRGANPLQWAYNHPANIDIRKLADYGSGNNILRVSDNHENPYFLAYDVNNSFSRYRIYGNVTGTWDITDKFSLMGRMTLNKSDEVRESKIAPGYTKEPNNGAYGRYDGTNLETNIDALLTYKNNWNDFSLTASGGGNIRYSRSTSISNSSKSGAGLTIPELYTVQNIPSGSLDYYSYIIQEGVNSIYAMANLSWKEIAYLDLTARNDWSSTLPSENWSYFYPSASLSLMVDQIFDLGSKVNMFKLRGGWAQVGNDTSPYNILATYSNAGQWGDAIRLQKPSGLKNPNFKPEQATSWEFGADVRLMDGRLRFDGTYYTSDNINQIFNVPLAVSSGYSSIVINAGLVQSEGWEFMLGFTPVKNSDWTWDLNINFTKNETRITELADGIDFVEFWDNARVKNMAFAKSDDPNSEYGVQDGLVGNLYARKTKRVEDKNSPYYGYPILGSGLDTEWQKEEEYSKVGNYNPDFIMGLQTSLSYKNFTLSATFDWRSGGQYVSQTYRYLSESVLTQTWLDELVHPGDLGGGASTELREWVIANEDKLLLSDRLRPVGGPTPEYGGFPESYSGYTVYDGTFAPGVVGYYDDNGTFIVEQENLGGEGTAFLPYVVSYPWDIGEANLFDADYIKLREISLSYRLPNKISQKAGLEDVDISIYSRNIMIWVKDPSVGIDPERAFQAESGGGFSQGVERYNAEPWVVPVGLKVNFTF